MPQTLVALAALLLSFCGLFTAVYEASLIRRAQRASVWPHLELSASINPRQVKLWAQNVGVGPARTHSVALTHRGRRLTDWGDLLDAVEIFDRTGLTFYQSRLGGRVLPADSERELIFHVSTEAAAEEAPSARTDALGEAIFDGSIDLEACYCSVFDECWVSTLQDIVRRTGPEATVREPQRVDDCEGRPASSI